MPERWLEANGDRARRGEMEDWMWAFSSGARVCIGRWLGVRSETSLPLSFFSRLDQIRLEGSVMSM